MSKAWNVTVDDVEEILEAHDSSSDADDVFDNFTEDLRLRVEKAVAWYSEYPDQVAAAKDEIEDILIEQKVLEKPKFFSTP